MIRIVVVDDRAFSRSAMRAVLNGYEDMSVVAEAADGIEAGRLAVELKPDVMIISQNLPPNGGLELAERLREQARAVGVLLFAVDQESVVRAERLGFAWISKDAGRGEIVEQIRVVARRAQRDRDSW